MGQKADAKKAAKVDSQLLHPKPDNLLVFTLGKKVRQGAVFQLI